ncbi:SRPBCC family protein [Frigidibacter sp. RF13]|uniref:SRPBCC family protein n=1 Tax=Frigidibacter sp. RF13 TaxID=2997340 RepID=UPI00226D5522|nr:SRPBCC family protein [Frigidibacter sp. RF13]MCY1128560.1 SRPBCC family protein [Frigidibacter sp. RF13]
MKIDPDRDIVIDRLLKAPPRLVWRCWTEPELFCQWYLPKPWRVSEAVMDLRAGGRFFMATSGEDGQRIANEGSFLEVVPERKLVFTDLFGEDFAPIEAPDTGFGPNFTAVLTFAPEGSGTRHRAVARHRSAADAAANREMGFMEGWAIVTDQLEELAATL